MSDGNVYVAPESIFERSQGVFAPDPEIQAKQEAAIAAAVAQHEQADGLTVTCVNPDGENQIIEFSDGCKVRLTRQQIAAIRMM